MRIVRFGFPVLVSGVVLLCAGCGGADQTTGSVVTETEESKQSRAAIENAVRAKPNMYAPPKKTGRR